MCKRRRAAFKGSQKYKKSRVLPPKNICSVVGRSNNVMERRFPIKQEKLEITDHLSEDEFLYHEGEKPPFFPGLPVLSHTPKRLSLPDDDLYREVESIWAIDSQQKNNTTRNEISTFSGSTITPESSDSSKQRRVRFLSPLVTQVGESHRVPPMERHHFYYSRENIMWFKHEYEAEKYPLCGICDSIKSAIEYCNLLFFAKQRTADDSLLEENNSVL